MRDAFHPRRRTDQIRRRRRVIRRRIAAFAVVLLLLAGVGFGVSRVLARDDRGQMASPAGATSSTATTVSISPTTGDPDADPGAISAASVRTATTGVTLTPEHLVIKSNPSPATVQLTLADGSDLEGKTPFDQEVAGGVITAKISKNGYIPITRQVDLTEGTSLTVWLDPEGLLHRSIGRFKCGPNPKQVAFSPDGKELWVSLLGGYGLEVFDPATFERVAQVKLGKHGAVEVIFTADGGTAYASQMETASVYEIDRQTREVRRILKTKGNWTKVLALSPDEKTLYAANWISNDVSEIDLATGQVTRLIKTVVTPRGLYPTPDGTRLYVAGYENGEIQRIDLATGKGTVLLKTGGAMRHMVGDPLTQRLYADDMALDQVYVVDLTTDEITELAKTDEKPNTIELSPDGKVLYVSCRGENNAESYYLPGPEWGSVLAIDSASGKILDAIVGGNQCTGLDVSPDGTVLAFSDFLDDRIRLYTIPSYQVLAEGGGGRAEAHLKDLAKD